MPASAIEGLKLNPQAGDRPTAASARMMKRALDVTGSAMGLILFAPVIVLLAVIVKIQDGGPAFYRRRVAGPAGEFDALKLRSMRVDADDILRRDAELREKFEVNFKLTDDPRVTRLGAFLRNYSLDELPQLWNVLKGQMSLVGPRMITPAELAKYGDAVWIFQQMKPGLTGYWQVYGGKNVTYEQRVEMDLHYAENWSLLLDAKILAMTPARVIRGPRTGSWQTS